MTIRFEFCSYVKLNSYRIYYIAFSESLPHFSDAKSSVGFV